MMTICMIAQAVDEKGEPVLLIRADKRNTTLAMQARYGKKPRIIEVFTDDVDKTSILSDRVGLAGAGSAEAVDYVRDRILTPLVPALAKDGLTPELKGKITNALIAAGHVIGADKEGMARVADLVVGVRKEDGSVEALRVMVMTKGQNADNVYKDKITVKLYRLNRPLAVGLDFDEPNMVLSNVCESWMGRGTKSHGVDVVGAMMEDVMEYELRHNRYRKYIDDGADYLVVSKDGIRKLSQDDRKVFEALNAAISSGDMAPREAVRSYERAGALNRHDIPVQLRRGRGADVQKEDMPKSKTV